MAGRCSVARSTSTNASVSNSSSASRDGVALRLRFALDLSPNRLCPREHGRVVLRAVDPELEGEPDLLCDRAVVELRDDVELRPKVVRHPDSEGAEWSCLSRQEGWLLAHGETSSSLLRPANRAAPLAEAARR